MECYFCKGKMKRGRTTYTVNKKGYHLLIDDAPALICTRCEEAYFEGEGIDAIQDVIKSLDAQISKMRGAVAAD